MDSSLDGQKMYHAQLQKAICPIRRTYPTTQCSKRIPADAPLPQTPIVPMSRFRPSWRSLATLPKTCYVGTSNSPISNVRCLLPRNSARCRPHNLSWKSLSASCRAFTFPSKYAIFLSFSGTPLASVSSKKYPTGT